MNDENAFSQIPPDQPPLTGFRPEPNEFRRLLRTLPSASDIAGVDDHQNTSDEIANAAAQAALKRSEARRDGVLAVALAIKRRGQNPLTDWTVQDTDTAYAIADQLIALS